MRLCRAHQRVQRRAKYNNFKFQTPISQVQRSRKSVTGTFAGADTARITSTDSTIALFIDITPLRVFFDRLWIFVHELFLL
jgi:hypothetical protein